MSARTDQIWEDCDSLCEHDFLLRVMQIGLVELTFDNWEQAKQYPDVLYLLWVQETCSSLNHRVRSIHYLLSELDREFDISDVRFNLRVLIESWRDASYAKISSLSDIVLDITDSVYELGIPSSDITFGNVQKRLQQNELKAILGRISDNKRDFRRKRNRVLHQTSWFDPDGYARAFEMASMMRNKGQDFRHAKSINEKEVPLQQLFNSRQSAIFDEATTEFYYLLPLVKSAFEHLYAEFDKRFKHKTKLQNSFVKKMGTR